MYKYIYIIVYIYYCIFQLIIFLSGTHLFTDLESSPQPLMQQALQKSAKQLPHAAQIRSANEATCPEVP
jgi:hypothetical protein